MGTNKKYLFLILFILILVGIVANENQNNNNFYENSTKNERNKFKKTYIPFKNINGFYVHQGAFGKYTHNKKNFEYFWDLDVPFGTEVVAVEDGKVVNIYEPNSGGGNDPKYSNSAHYIIIWHQEDDTYSCYVHINSKVSLNDYVKKGDVIAVTTFNGYISNDNPHLHFGIYNNNNPQSTIPLFFNDIEGGILKEKHYYSIIQNNKNKIASNTVSSKKLYELYYDNGEYRDFFSPWSNLPGSMVTVKFTPKEYPFKINKALFFIPNIGNYKCQFKVRIFNENNENFLPGNDLVTDQILASATFGNSMVEIDLSDKNIIINSGNYFIAMEWLTAPNTTDGLNAQYIALDKSINKGRSYIFYPSQNWLPISQSYFKSGEIAIRSEGEFIKK